MTDEPYRTLQELNALPNDVVEHKQGWQALITVKGADHFVLRNRDRWSGNFRQWRMVYRAPGATAWSVTCSPKLTSAPWPTPTRVTKSFVDPATESSTTVSRHYAQQVASLSKIFRAGRVRRWHTNPDLCDTVDHIDGHAGRVARVMLILWPQTSAAALRAALTHDDGEHAAADLSRLVKREHPALAQAAAEVETAARRDLWGDDPDLTETERSRLEFVDKLDAIMWVAHHRPHMLRDDGWPEAMTALSVQAATLGADAAGQWLSVVEQFNA